MLLTRILLLTAFTVAPFRVLFAQGSYEIQVYGSDLVSPQTSPELAIVHVTVIDVRGGAVLPERTVAIQDGRIVSVRPDNILSFPHSTRVLDASGKYLIPGLWDMHVHMRGPRSGAGADFTSENEAVLPLYLANGVTGVREMGGDLVNQVLEWRGQVERGERRGPRIATSGPKLDGPRPEWPGSIAISTPEQAREAVRHVKAMGADFVKVYNGVPNIPREAYLALLDEARLRHIAVTGHVPLTLTVAEVSDHGQNIEHTNEYLAGCIRNERGLKTELIEGRISGDKFETAVVRGYNRDVARALFARFAANRTWVTPTLVVARQLSDAASRTPPPDPRREYLPSRWLASWNDRSYEPETLDRQRCRQSIETVRLMRQAGVSILAGSDTGVSNPDTFPGFSLQDELVELVRAGLTPIEALQSATRNPAIWLNKQDTLGAIEPGKLADLVLLDANPLRDIHNIRRIRAVIFNGQLLERNRLDQILAEVTVSAKR